MAAKKEIKKENPFIEKEEAGAEDKSLLSFFSEEAKSFIEIKGNLYKFRQYNVIIGLKVFKNILNIFAPLIGEISDIENVETENYMTYISLLGKISDDDLDYIYKHTLSQVQVDLKGGSVPVIDKQGLYQVPEIEYDLEATIKLIIGQFHYGFSPFFPQLQSLMSTL